MTRGPLRRCQTKVTVIYLCYKFELNVFRGRNKKKTPAAYLCGCSQLGDKRFMSGVYGGTADVHLDESLLMLVAAFILLSLAIGAAAADEDIYCYGNEMVFFLLA